MRLFLHIPGLFVRFPHGCPEDISSQGAPVDQCCGWDWGILQDDRQIDKWVRGSRMEEGVTRGKQTGWEEPQGSAALQKRVATKSRAEKKLIVDRVYTVVVIGLWTPGTIVMYCIPLRISVESQRASRFQCSHQQLSIRSVQEFLIFSSLTVHNKIISICVCLWCSQSVLLKHTKVCWIFNNK